MQWWFTHSPNNINSVQLSSSKTAVTDSESVKNEREELSWCFSPDEDDMRDESSAAVFECVLLCAKLSESGLFYANVLFRFAWLRCLDGICIFHFSKACKSQKE
jgi:hypothetical protein